MYYHSCPLKYVEYGKVFPHRDEDNWLLPTYEWLSNYCGYSPQIWLSRSTSCITGYRSSNALKKREKVIRNRKNTKIGNDSVLFGFENIQGFPLNYEVWSLVLHIIIGSDSDGKDISKTNKIITETLDQYAKWSKDDNSLEEDEVLASWDKNRDLDSLLKKHLFVEKDQVVVPSLNLKSAKKIICKNEKQKKKLRKMGFIEDRIIIKNLRYYGW